MGMQGIIPPNIDYSKSVSDRYKKKTYKKGETCIKYNKLYQAKENIDEPEEWNPEHWEETTVEQLRAQMQQEIEAVNANIADLTPDDTAVGSKPWTSRHIVDMLCPPLEVSGNPVQCYPVPGYPLGITASWELVQEGEGDPSPDNIRPIKGRDAVLIKRQEDDLEIQFSLPETICSGSIDATGNGSEVWKLISLNGTESWRKYFSTDGIYVFQVSSESSSSQDYKTVNMIADRYNGVSRDAIRNNLSTADLMCSSANQEVVIADKNYQTVSEWKAYLAEQYAVGTPVQIARKLSEPASFTATEGTPVPALSGINTILTDADSLEVTGREDLIHSLDTL